MSRKLTFYQKEHAKHNKDTLGIQQGGKCFYCGLDFESDNIYPHAAHRIIDSKVNIKKYGYDILDNILNFRITCSNCNSKAIVNPETQSGQDLIREIMESI